MHRQDLYAVYGASGCGRGVMPLARQQLVHAGVPASRLVFVDDAPGPPEVNGQRLLSYAQFLAEPAAARHCVLAIASGTVREALAQRCAAQAMVCGPGAWPLPPSFRWTTWCWGRAWSSARSSR